jgi:hypothetical protein
VIMHSKSWHYVMIESAVCVICAGLGEVAPVHCE